MEYKFMAIEREKRKNIIENKIDKFNYLGLNSDRSRLVNLGMALGVDLPKEIKVKDSLSRPGTVKSDADMMAIITCASVANLKGNEELNEALSTDKLFELANKCLNKGLEVIEDKIDNIPENNHKYLLIEELDELYEKYVIKKESY